MNTNVRSRLQARLLSVAVAGACALGASLASAAPISILTPNNELTFSGEVNGGVFKFNDIFKFDTSATTGNVDFRFADVSNITDLSLKLKDADGAGSSFVALTADADGKGFHTTSPLDTGDLYKLDVSGFGKKHGDSEFRLYAEMGPAVPEPAEWALIGTGLLMLGAWSLRRRAQGTHTTHTAASA